MIDFKNLVLEQLLTRRSLFEQEEESQEDTYSSPQHSTFQSGEDPIQYFGNPDAVIDFHKEMALLASRSETRWGKLIHLSVQSLNQNIERYYRGNQQERFSLSPEQQRFAQQMFKTPNQPSRSSSANQSNKPSATPAPQDQAKSQDNANIGKVSIQQFVDRVIQAAGEMMRQHRNLGASVYAYQTVTTSTSETVKLMPLGILAANSMVNLRMLIRELTQMAKDNSIQINPIAIALSIASQTKGQAINASEGLSDPRAIELVNTKLAAFAESIVENIQEGQRLLNNDIVPDQLLKTAPSVYFNPRVWLSYSFPDFSGKLADPRAVWKTYLHGEIKAAALEAAKASERGKGGETARAWSGLLASMGKTGSTF